MASGQPSGVPLPSRKTVSGLCEPEARTWPPPLAGARSTYLCALARFMSGLKWNSGRGEYFSQITIKQRRESQPASLISLAASWICGSARPKLQKGNLSAAVFLLRAAATVRTLNACVLFTRRRLHCWFARRLSSCPVGRGHISARAAPSLCSRMRKIKPPAWRRDSTTPANERGLIKVQSLLVRSGKK